MEKNKHPPSFLQDVHHLPRFPGGDSGPNQASLVATSSKRLSWFPRIQLNSARFHRASVICQALCWVPSGISSLAFVAPVATFGVAGRAVQSRAFGTCGSKHLLVSLLPPGTVVGRGCPEVQKK